MVLTAVHCSCRQCCRTMVLPMQRSCRAPGLLSQSPAPQRPPCELISGQRMSPQHRCASSSRKLRCCPALLDLPVAGVSDVRHWSNMPECSHIELAAGNVCC